MFLLGFVVFVCLVEGEEEKMCMIVVGKMGVDFIDMVWFIG